MNAAQVHPSVVDKFKKIFHYDKKISSISDFRQNLLHFMDFKSTKIFAIYIFGSKVKGKNWLQDFFNSAECLKSKSYDI